MPAGVAVLERLGLRDAVGGLPLHKVRYHGFGLSAEAAFPTRDGRHAGRAGPAPAAARRHAAGGGARHPERARLRGGARRGRGRRARPRHRPARRRRAPPRRARRRRRRHRLARCAARWGSTATARARHGSACGCTSAWPVPGPRPDLEIFVGNGYELYVTPLPDGELGLAALCPRRRAHERRARGALELVRRGAAPRRLARRRDAPDARRRGARRSRGGPGPASRPAPCCWATPPSRAIR